MNCIRVRMRIVLIGSLCALSGCHWLFPNNSGNENENTNGNDNANINVNVNENSSTEPNVRFEYGDPESSLEVLGNNGTIVASAPFGMLYTEHTKYQVYAGGGFLTGLSNGGVNILGFTPESDFETEDVEFTSNAEFRIPSEEGAGGLLPLVGSTRVNAKLNEFYESELEIYESVVFFSETDQPDTLSATTFYQGIEFTGEGAMTAPLPGYDIGDAFVQDPSCESVVAGLDDACQQVIDHHEALAEDLVSALSDAWEGELSELESLINDALRAGIVDFCESWQLYRTHNETPCEDID